MADGRRQGVHAGAAPITPASLLGRPLSDGRLVRRAAAGWTAPARSPPARRTRAEPRSATGLAFTSSGCAAGDVLVVRQVEAVDGALHGVVDTDPCERGIEGDVTLLYLGVNTP